MTELAGAGQLRRASQLLRGSAPVPDRALADAVRAVRVALTDAAGWPDRMAGPADALARTAWRDDGGAAYVASLRTELAALMAAAEPPEA